MTQRPFAADPEYIKLAFADLGMSETPGPRHSKRVLEMFRHAGHPEVKNDETAWCAAAVGAWLREAGYPNTGSLMARSYVRYGRKLDTTKSIPRGAICVWPRGAPPSGHVNLCLEDDGSTLTCIGGNQGNGNGGGVTITKERKEHILAAVLPRAIVAAPLPKPRPKPEITPEVTPRPQPDDPGVEPTPEPDEKLPWYKKIWAWVTGGGASMLLGGIYDYRVALTIFGSLIFLLIAFVLFMGPSRVREWIRKRANS